ncbi:response regulator [Paenibacillus mendelii]|uniref:Response regulator n=1 Tax=Paenibacillus mendelii TaxID=206163 RepID=A0ABV6JG53_9BACL|nr:response regulator [Paenibacillus mendelii]MCQ6557397.1 response regulator [Paenibacillus mendelii]
MCKVLLVDDEKMARMGMRAVLDWETNGFELVGEASNGEKAMHWIRDQQVDILITDIAMPVMDGLELTRKAKELCPFIKVLLLSCHNDFEYVREGIRLGASDYILKPTLNAESLLTVLHQMRRKQEEERENRQIVELFKDHLHASKRKELEKTFSKALRGDRDAIGRLKLAYPDEKYRFVAIGVDVFAESDTDKAELLIEQTEIIQTQLYDNCRSYVAALHRPDLVMAVLPARTPHECHTEELNEWLSGLRTGSNPELIHISIGISGYCEGFADIQESCLEAKRALDHVFFSGPGSKLSAIDTAAADCPSALNYNYAAALNELKESLTMGYHSKAEEQLRIIVGHWSPRYRTKVEVLQEAEELFTLFLLCKDVSAANVRRIRRSDKFRYAEDVIRHVLECFEELRVGEEYQKPDTTLHQRIVKQAIHFMEAHYTEAISLQQVADEVNVSRNYFSEMFKRVTGQNFIDYVIALRVKRAKELLQASSLRVYEVAEQSGFNDVKHFSKQFKKIAGLSPAEYQGMWRK